MVWSLLPFKGDFNFVKSQKLQGAKSGIYGSWVTWVIWCSTRKLCTRCDAWADALLWWSCQSLVAHSCDHLNHLNGFCRGMFKLNAKFDVDSLLYSFILNVMATQYTCSLDGIYRPHWLIEWSCPFSHMHIPVHSPWPGYISVVQTILNIVTMAGLCLNRLHIRSLEITSLS